MPNFVADGDQPPRPKDWDIEEKFGYYRRAEEEKEGSGQYMIDELKEFIAGKGDEEAKVQYYPGWQLEDFERLLDMIEQGY